MSVSEIRVPPARQGRPAFRFAHAGYDCFTIVPAQVSVARIEFVVCSPDERSDIRDGVARRGRPAFPPHFATPMRPGTCCPRLARAAERHHHAAGWGTRHEGPKA